MHCSKPWPASRRRGLQSALERLAEADILFIEGVGPQANYRFKHALIQDAAHESLLKSRRQALHRRAAEILRDQPNARPSRRRSRIISLEAGLDDLAIEWWGKAGDQALRRSAFQEAIAHLSKAIEMADRAGAVARRATGGSAAPNPRLTQLHAAYGNALIAARGYGAPETTEAFARARESASGDKDTPERLAADYGLWVGSYLRGDLAIDEGARRGLPQRHRGETRFAGGRRRPSRRRDTCWFAGEYREARDPSKGRSPCSNPAATTIWPFASDMTPASAQCLAWRSCRGRLATSNARLP